MFRIQTFSCHGGTFKNLGFANWTIFRLGLVWEIQISCFAYDKTQGEINYNVCKTHLVSSCICVSYKLNSLSFNRQVLSICLKFIKRFNSLLYKTILTIRYNTLQVLAEIELFDNNKCKAVMSDEALQSF